MRVGWFLDSVFVMFVIFEFLCTIDRKDVNQMIMLIPQFSRSLCLCLSTGFIIVVSQSRL